MEHYRHQLPTSLWSVYSHYLQALRAAVPRFPSENLSAPTINHILHYILLDHPELCHFEGKWGLQTDIYPHYVLSPSHSTVTSQTAEQIARFFKSEDSHMFLKNVYEWMLSYVRYDPYALNSQNAYGALMERCAACKGIAKAFQLILQAENIPCITVEGSLDGIGKHVWNLVLLNGKWLHIDICMGYPPFQTMIHANDSFSCFCIDTKTIRQTHQIHSLNLFPSEESV